MSNLTIKVADDFVALINKQVNAVVKKITKQIAA